ncbi:MAG: hypothetical protein K6T61_09665 [Bryobacteraceae bacterium]|nr:hypothetical protein [Bryobacteraceae bacterium]
MVTTNLPRWFLLRAPGPWLAVSAVLAVLSSGCRPSSVQVDPALAALVPPDALALAGIDLASLRSTPAFSKWIAPNLERLGKENNTDLAGQSTQMLAVTDGKTVTVFARTRTGVVRLNSKDPLPSPNGGIPPRLRRLLGTIPAHNQIWSAGAGTAALLAQALPGANPLAVLKQVTAGMDSYTAAADLRQGLKLEARATYSSPEELARVHDGLRGLLSLARMSTPKNRSGLLRLYDGIQIRQDQGALLVEAEYSAQELDSVFFALPRR